MKQLNQNTCTSLYIEPLILHVSKDFMTEGDLSNNNNPQTIATLLVLINKQITQYSCV